MREVYERTDENDMIIELSLILFVTAHLGHLLESVKHGLNNLIIGRIDTLSNFKGVRSNKLCLDTANVRREVLDEVSYSSPLFGIKLRPFYTFDLLIL